MAQPEKVTPHTVHYLSRNVDLVRGLEQIRQSRNTSLDRWDLDLLQEVINRLERFPEGR